MAIFVVDSVLLLVILVECGHPLEERRVGVVPGGEEPVVDGEAEVVVVQLHQRRPQLRRPTQGHGEGVGLQQGGGLHSVRDRPLSTHDVRKIFEICLCSRNPGLPLFIELYSRNLTLYMLCWANPLPPQCGCQL